MASIIYNHLTLIVVILSSLLYKYFDKLLIPLKPCLFIINCIRLKQFKLNYLLPSNFVTITSFTGEECKIINLYKKYPDTMFQLIPSDSYYTQGTDHNREYYNQLKKRVLETNKNYLPNEDIISPFISSIESLFKVLRKPTDLETEALSSLIAKGLLKEETRGHSSYYPYQKTVILPKFKKMFM